MFKTDLEAEGYKSKIIDTLNPSSGDFRGSDRSRTDDQVNANLNTSFKQGNSDNPNFKIYTHFGIFS